MISLNDLQEIIATTFLDGDTGIAGLIMFVVVLMVVLALTKNVSHSLIICLPVTLIFTMLGILPMEMTILLIIVIVLALAFTSRNIWTEE